MLDLIFCPPDEDKLKWAFRLYDMDNNGVIDMDEMAAIIETLDCIEGVKPGWQIHIFGEMVLRTPKYWVATIIETLDCIEGVKPDFGKKEQ